MFWQPSLKICGGSSKFGIWAMIKSSLKFNSARAFKSQFSAGVEASATLHEVRNTEGFTHGLINYTGTKANWRHLKKLTCKVTLRQVFIRVFRPGVQPVMLVFLDPAL
jgi:hypothetical protein